MQETISMGRSMVGASHPFPQGRTDSALYPYSEAADNAKNSDAPGCSLRPGHVRIEEWQICLAGTIC